MRLVKPSFTIVGGPVDGGEVLKRIEAAGRTCYKSEDRITEDSCRAFVAMIIQRDHGTVLEHEKVTVRIVCDRGVSHELVRHRIASFSQESTRYCDYGKGEHITFVIPPQCVNIKEGEYTARGDFDYPNNYECIWAEVMAALEVDYRDLRSEGWRPEEARSILPNSLKTEVVVTANLREWRHIFKLRTAPAAHPQMREIMVPMLAEFKQMIPVVFDDINPEGGK